LYEYGGPENLKYEDNVCRAPDRTFQSTGFTLVAELSTSTESSLNAGDIPWALFSTTRPELQASFSA
jgi:hypothetical protein